ncbi:MAG: acyl carrier protein [Clostridia bacterium]|nr:acyl carrier protein [Clostridia bacterium]MDD4387208.1 acyl carrier protein [Clostridia bacterium]
MEAIIERVKEVISEQLGIEDVDSITLETTFIDDLGADSLDIVELIMALEEEFDMEIPEVEAEKIISVGDVVEYIHKAK